MYDKGGVMLLKQYRPNKQFRCMLCGESTNIRIMVDFPETCGKCLNEIDCYCADLE